MPDIETLSPLPVASDLTISQTDTLTLCQCGGASIECLPRTLDSQHEFARAIFSLRTNPSQLTEVASLKNWSIDHSKPTAPQHTTRQRFLDIIESLTGQTAIFCNDCDSVIWENESPNGSICESCEEDYAYCENCEESVPQDSINVVQPKRGTNDCYVCDDCLKLNYYRCYSCREYVHDDYVNSIQNENYCNSCAQSSNYCEECSESYFDDECPNGCNDNEYCECQPLSTKFEFPNDGHGLVANDERFTVELGAGIVSTEGLNSIRQVLAHLPVMDDKLPNGSLITDMDPRWQTKDGNFPKRVSKLIHKYNGYKLDPATMSKIGNIARDNSSSDNSYELELTRNLNLYAEEFGNEDSCWWTTHTTSRCEFKAAGGIGLRAFNSNGSVIGRTWILPLRNRTTTTTTISKATSFLVFNGYGTLEPQYVAARIVAHLTGLSYTKVSANYHPMYINGNSGYLITPIDECTADNISTNIDQHKREC